MKVEKIITEPRYDAVVVVTRREWGSRGFDADLVLQGQVGFSVLVGGRWVLFIIKEEDEKNEGRIQGSRRST